MSTALVRPDGSVRRTHFPALCGSQACQETGEHAHPDCPECGRPLMPGLASLDCWTCQLACYGGPSRVYPVVLTPDLHITTRAKLALAESRARRYLGALLEIYALGAGHPSAIAGRALGLTGLEAVS